MKIAPRLLGKRSFAALRTTQPLRGSVGFTLMELIVVLLVFSILAVMAYGGLASVMKTRKAVEDSLARTTQFQKAYVRLRDDFQNLRNRTARDDYGETQAALIGSADAGVEFTRGGWRNPLMLPRSSLERIAYRVEDRTLQRLSWRALDRAPDAKPVILDLLSGVDELRWRYLDGDNEWQEAWPPGSQSGGAPTGQAAQQIAMPKAVELKLVTKDWGELRFLFKVEAAANTPQIPPPGGPPGPGGPGKLPNQPPVVPPPGDSDGDGNLQNPDS